MSKHSTWSAPRIKSIQSIELAEGELFNYILFARVTSDKQHQVADLNPQARAVLDGVKELPYPTECVGALLLAGCHGKDTKGEVANILSYYPKGKRSLVCMDASRILRHPEWNPVKNREILPTKAQIATLNDYLEGEDAWVYYLNEDYETREERGGRIQQRMKPYLWKPIMKRMLEVGLSKHQIATHTGVARYNVVRWLKQSNCTPLNSL
jgi:hypothetical protein